jgi:tetratricopeptide (TPR) repeat protein
MEGEASASRQDANPMRVEKTVFISYRHTNQYHALAIYQALTAKGYDAFIDFQSIDSGSFERIILGEIDARAHFLVILTPSALKDCDKPGDWLRREIERAIEMKRNIVPVMFERFDFGAVKDQLTGKLAALPEYQGLPIPSALIYFDHAMELLMSKQFLNKPLDMVLHPTLPDDRAEVEEQKAAAEAAPAPTEEQLSAEQYFERANARYDQSDYAGAIIDLTEAIRLNPQYVPAYINRGAARAGQGDSAGAIADYDEAIRLDPQLAWAYSDRGAARDDLGDYAGAIADYDEAIRLNPQFADAYNNRGAARAYQGDHAEAIADFTEAIRLAQYAAAYYNRANARANQGDHAGAIADYTEAIRLNPQDDAAYFQRGVARYGQEDYAGAIADSTEAIRLNPLFAMAYYNRGNTRYHQGDYPGSIADFSEVIRLDPQMMEAYVGRGEAHFALEPYDQALSDFKKANDLRPGHNFALAGLAITHHARGNAQEARRLWRILLGMDERYRDAEWVKTELNWAEPLVEEARRLIAGL